MTSREGSESSGRFSFAHFFKQEVELTGTSIGCDLLIPLIVQKVMIPLIKLGEFVLGQTFDCFFDFSNAHVVTLDHPVL